MVYMAVKKKSAKSKATVKTVKKKAAARKTAPAKKVAKKTAKKTAKKAPRKKTPVKNKAAAKKTPKKVAASRKSGTGRKTATVKGQVGPVAGITPYVEKRGEQYMNEKQIEHFRNILKAWKRDLMEEVDRTVHHMQDDAANFPDPNDRATQESEFSMELRARDRERKLIKKIDEAILNLDNDNYGYCEACGVEIGVKRLEARPTATLCIDCKILDEIREKQMG
jgi:DnaK suppressor protein